MNAKRKVFETLNNGKLTTIDVAGYIMNEQGDMCRITDAMIKLACQQLKAQCHVPGQPAAKPAS